MKLSISTDSYNQRRHGRPWIAVVDFSITKKGEFTFGDWIGQPGEAGILEIEVNAGDIVARGQKDLRKPSNSAPIYYQVQPDGTLSERMTLAEAYETTKATQPADVDLAALRAERDSLLTRLAELNEVI